MFVEVYSMSDFHFGEAVETLSTLTAALGGGLAAWGIINLLEAYDDAAAAKEVKEQYRRRMERIDLSLQGLFADKAAGKITAAQYKSQCAVYDAELDELIDAISEVDAEIAARKRQGLTQIMGGASLAALGPELCGRAYELAAPADTIPE